MPTEWTADTPQFDSTPRLTELPIKVSPVFLLILVATVAAAYLTYAGLIFWGAAVFLFVTGGWLVSLCLHEFGHALVAYWGGDAGVVEKGYLTLNPFKYTHRLTSIIFPLLIMALGGIGLPGGAVYINTGAIRSKGTLSLVSAAGPLANALIAGALLIPFILGWPNLQSHLAFWAGLAMLAFLQITALAFNLLPLPGLDGFGILAPYLPAQVVRAAYAFGQFTLFIVFFLFINDTPIRRWFWGTIGFITQLVNLSPALINLGFDLFRFWSNLRA